MDARDQQQQPILPESEHARRTAPPVVRAPLPTIPAFLLCEVTAHNADTLECGILLPDGSTGATIEVAKPPELRQSYYAGQTFDGATYTAGSAGTRTATGPVTQNIVPAYRTTAPAARIFAFRPHNGTGIGGVDWQDLNADARAWADEPPA